MSPRRILALALGTQCLLVALAWTLAHALGLPPRWGSPLRDMAIGVGAAGLLAASNYVLLEHAPSNWIVDGVRSVYQHVLVPLFSRLPLLSIVALGAAAGIGEEWLFRGILQAELGIVAASLLFGLAHVGGVHMLPFGVWASGMGFVLGALAAITGGLTAPIVAHGVYDMLALAYIRKGARHA